jgi:hypothetical protein
MPIAPNWPPSLEDACYAPAALRITELEDENRRLRGFLEKIATIGYCGEDLWDCPPGTAPDQWLALKALGRAAKP